MKVFVEVYSFQERLFLYAYTQEYINEHRVAMLETNINPPLRDLRETTR